MLHPILNGTAARLHGVAPVVLRDELFERAWRRSCRLALAFYIEVGPAGGGAEPVLNLEPSAFAHWSRDAMAHGRRHIALAIDGARHRRDRPSRPPRE